MIKAVRLLIFLTGLVFATETFGQAIPPGTGGVMPPPSTPSTPTMPSGGATCDLTALKKSIQSTESSKGCAQRGPMTKYGQAAGKYQFIPDTWNRMAKGCPGASGCGHATAAFYNDPICCQVQECAMDNLLLTNKPAILNSKTCQSIMGKTISSPKYGSCTVTLSGLLAAWHLGGADACNGVANGNYGDSDGHTTEADYMCKHKGIPVPDDCQPSTQPDPNQTPPIGTLQQIEIQIAQGDDVWVGSGAGLLYNWVGGLMLMAEQFTAAMAAQMQSLGMLLDAKDQLESQRLFQEKMAEAHKDYQPSEQMCTFGTFARELVATERSANLTRNALSTELLQREIASGDSMARGADMSDSLSRINNYRRYFCSQGNNANGLALLCPTPAPAAMRDRDINYTQTMDQPLSLNVNLMDTDTTDDERAIFALVDNLFVHDPMPNLPSDALNQPKYQYHYMNVRSIVAMRGILRNSIANIIAIKTASPQDADSNSPYLRALFREFGIEDAEIRELLGEHPSYYAQMELLTKKIYQNPMFYTNLYDKPANVKRIRAAMTAIKLMQDRDIAASLQRREMLLSIMLELRLREQADAVYSITEEGLFAPQN